MPMRAPFLPSIRQRVTHTLLVISLLWGLLIAGVVGQVVSHEVDELMDQGLRESAEMFHSVVARLPPDAQRASGASAHTDYEKHLVWQLVEGGTGAVVARSHQAPASALVRSLSPETHDTADGQWRVVTLGLEPSPDRFLVVAQSTLERDDARQEIILYTLAGALLLGGLATWALSARMRRELQPLADLSQAVQGYDPLRTTTAPPAADRAELAPIERAVRELGERLARRVASERAFTAHAAHALRTPLAGIDAQLAVALREAPDNLQARLRSVRQASTRLARVVQALLSMFRSGMEPQRQRFALADLVASLGSGGLRVVCEGEPQLRADADLLAAVLMNLLDNAQRHGAGQVRLRVSRDQGQNRLDVLDDGEGCDSATRARLRTALAQQDHGADGLKGLGLVLADLVMRAHDGHMSLPDVAQGFGVTLVWPDEPRDSGGPP